MMIFALQSVAWFLGGLIALPLIFLSVVSVSYLFMDGDRRKDLNDFLVAYAMHMKEKRDLKKLQGELERNIMNAFSRTTAYNYRAGLRMAFTIYNAEHDHE